MTEGVARKTLEKMLKRSIRGAKVTGTRLIITKALVDLGDDWHSVDEISEKIEAYEKDLWLDPSQYILDMCSIYGDMIESSPHFTLIYRVQDARFRIKPKVFPFVAKIVAEFIKKLKEERTKRRKKGTW